MFRDLKVDLYKTLKEIHENAYKQFNKIMKTIKGMKVEFIKEIESLRKIQTKRKLEMKILVCQIKITVVSLTNRLQYKKKRFSGFEDKVEELNTSVKYNVKSKNNPDAKHLRNLVF